MEEVMDMEDMGDTATQDMDIHMDMVMDMDTVMGTVCIHLPYRTFRFMKKIIKIIIMFLPPALV